MYPSQSVILKVTDFEQYFETVTSVIPGLCAQVSDLSESSSACVQQVMLQNSRLMMPAQPAPGECRRK